MSSTHLVIAGGILVAGAVVAAAPDYNAIPPKAGDVQAMIESKPVDLARAIEIAAKSGGIVAAASFDLDQSAASINVTVFADGRRHSLVIDSTTGSIVSDEIISRFPGDPVEGDWKENDSGLKYYDIVVGDGPMPSGPTSTVKVHYSGWLNDGTKFDSSVDRGKPSTFALNRVISGWTEGVGSMRVGGKRKLIIPYALAYGESGRRSIPPKATLIFDIELLEIVGE